MVADFFFFFDLHTERRKTILQHSCMEKSFTNWLESFFIEIVYEKILKKFFTSQIESNQRFIYSIKSFTMLGI